MASLYLDVHQVCGDLVSYCKELMSSVMTRDQETFSQWWNATCELVAHLVQLVTDHPVDPRLATEKEEVLAQAKNIEQLVTWILNELQKLHEDPGSKTPAEIQQLSTNVRDQLRVGLLALGNVTKKFTVMGAQLSQQPGHLDENSLKNSSEVGHEEIVEDDQDLLEIARKFLFVVADHSHAVFNSDNQSITLYDKDLNTLVADLRNRAPRNLVEPLTSSFVAFQQTCRQYRSSGDPNAANIFVSNSKQLEEIVFQLIPLEYRPTIEIEIQGRIQQYEAQAALSENLAPTQADQKPPRPDSSVLELSRAPPVHFTENIIEEEDTKTEETDCSTDFDRGALVQRILEIMAETCPKSWESFPAEKRGSIQRGIQQNLIHYEMSRKRSLQAREQTKHTIQNSVTISPSASKKKKGDNRAKRPPHNVLELGGPGVPSQGMSLGNATSNIMTALYDFGLEFCDNEPSWDQNWKPPFKVAHYANHPSKKILEVNTNLIINELKSITEGLTIANPSEAFATIKGKIKDFLVYRKPVVLPHDTKQFAKKRRYASTLGRINSLAKAQHLRWAKRELLNAINIRIESFQTLCTQFLTTYQTATRTDDIETYHLLGLISQYQQMLLNCQDDVETFLEFGKIECNYKRGPFTKIKTAKGASDGVWKDKASYESVQALKNSPADHELENQNWSKDKTQVLARNAIDLITRTNHVSYYVATMIVNTRKYKMRVRLLSRFISVAKYCLELGNMTGLMGILTGLSQSCVSRLKHTWAKLPTSQQVDWKRFEALQDPSSAFKNWRDQMALIKDPKMFKSIPYIGLLLSDLTFMDEGNPLLTEKGLINFPKFQMITNGIKEFLKYQKNQYDLEPIEPLFTIAKKLPSLMLQDVFMEKELFALSLEREPRNSDPKTLE